jgi:hypothetical protein
MPLDADDLKKISEMTAAIVRDAVKDFATADTIKKVVDQNIAKAVDGLKLDEKIAALKPKDEAKDDPAGAKKDGKQDKVDPTVARFEEKIAQLERQNKESADRVAQERAKREEQEAIGALRDALSTNGVPADRQAMAIAKLYHADKVVKRDAEGKLHVQVARAAGYTDNLELGAFVKEYLATDEGKILLPPTGASGTGTGSGNNGRGTAATTKLADLTVPLG